MNLKLDSQVILERWNVWSKRVTSLTLADVPSLPIKLIEDMKNSSKLQISKNCLGLVAKYLESLNQETWKQSIAFNVSGMPVYVLDSMFSSILWRKT